MLAQLALSTPLKRSGDTGQAGEGMFACVAGGGGKHSAPQGVTSDMVPGSLTQVLYWGAGGSAAFQPGHGACTAS
jgi:hypothetical protein